MATQSFNIGQQITLRASFKDKAGATGVLVDPTTVTLKLETPSGVESTHVYLTDPNVIKDAVGLYHYDLTPDEASTDDKDWTHRWIGTGTFPTANERPIKVNDTVFGDP